MNNELTPEQQEEIDALIALPDDEIDTSDAPEHDEEHNFFREHGIPHSEERFRVFKKFREMYGEDEKGFPKFYAGYQLCNDEEPNLGYLLITAIRAMYYIAESMSEQDQNILAGNIFQILPQLILKNQKDDEKA